MTHIKRIVCVLLAGLVAFGCAPADPAPQPNVEARGAQELVASPSQTVTQPTQVDVEPLPAGVADGLDAKLRALAAHMPADTTGAIYVNIAAILQDQGFVTELLTSFIGIPHLVAMRAELASFLDGRLGFDPLTVEWIVISVSEQGKGAMFVGGLKLPDTLEKSTVEGIEIVHGKEGGLRFAKLAKLDAYMFFPKTRQIEEYAAIVSGQTPKLEGERLEALVHTASKAGAGIIIAVGLVNGPMLTAMLEELPAPVRKLESVALSAGSDVTLRVIVSGDATSIGALEGFYGIFSNELLARAKEGKADLAGKNLEDAMGIVLAYHGLSALIERFSPTFDGGEARLEITLPGGSATIGALLALGGAGAATFLTSSKEEESFAFNELTMMATEMTAVAEEHKGDCDKQTAELEAFVASREGQLAMLKAELNGQSDFSTSQQRRFEEVVMSFQGATAGCTQASLQIIDLMALLGN